MSGRLEINALMIRPSVAPRGLADVLVVAGLVLVLAAGFGALCAGVARLVGVPVAAFLPLLPLLALLVRARTVRALQLDAAGIRFVRSRGGPRFVAWEQVRSVRPATRWEVVLDGWLRSPLSPREATPSLSSEGHYRIEWDGGVAYYPPVDEGGFRDAVLRWRGIDVWEPTRAGGESGPA